MRQSLLVVVTAACAAVAGGIGSGLVTQANAKASLDQTNQRLTLLEDHNAIMNLNRIYGYYLDKALFNQLLDLFTEDVSLEYSGRGVYIGKQRATQLMKAMPGGETGLQDGMLQNHMQIQGVVHVDPNGQTAKGRWRALIMMKFAGEKGQEAWQEGIYENEYRKENGVWKFSKVHFYLNVNADYHEGWAKSTGWMPGIDKNFPPDKPPSDPNYKSYPAAYIPPFHYKNPVTGK